MERGSGAAGGKLREVSTVDKLSKHEKQGLSYLLCRSLDELCPPPCNMRVAVIVPSLPLLFWRSDVHARRRVSRPSVLFNPVFDDSDTVASYKDAWCVDHVAKAWLCWLLSANLSSLSSHGPGACGRFGSKYRALTVVKDVLLSWIQAHYLIPQFNKVAAVCSVSKGMMAIGLCWKPLLGGCHFTLHSKLRATTCGYRPSV